MNTEILSGLFGFVIIGAIVYFMVRKGGCCGHSQGGEHAHEKPGADKAKDPVCKMYIEEEKASGKCEYGGKTYYFCGAGCKESFEKEPEKYIKTTEKQVYEHRCC